MKKFFFPLDTVLSYKEQVLENLRGEHARIIAKVRACEREIEGLEQEHQSCAKAFEKSKFTEMKISDIHTYEHYLEALGIKIKKKQEELLKLNEQEEEKRNEVVEAKKETSSIEKLKEKKFKEYNKEVLKQEELFIEEFVSTQNAMAKLNG